MNIISQSPILLLLHDARVAGARVGYGLYVWSVALLIGLPAVLRIALCRDQVHAWRLNHRAAARMVRLWSIPLSVRWETDSALPEPHVVVTNHCSYLDCIFVAALLPRPHVVVVKAELQRIPILSTYLRKLGSIFVERSAPDRRMLEIEQMEEALARGTSVIVFPEGTFTRVAGLRPFHLGAFEIAVVSSVPIIPLTLHGTRSVLRDGHWLPRRLPVRAVVGAPLRLPVGKDTLSATLRLRDVARAAVLQHCGEPDLL